MERNIEVLDTNGNFIKVIKVDDLIDR